MSVAGGRFKSQSLTLPATVAANFTEDQAIYNPLIKEYTLNHIRDPIII